jgi:electron transfer flavoprotein beta subunit
MKVLVPVKRVIDANVKPRVKPDGSGIDLANTKMAMNPFCEIAVEEAIRLKEAGKAEEIVLVSIGPAQAAETIRTGLAMGADRGILVQVEGIVEPLAVAKILKGVVQAEQPASSSSASRPSTTTPTRPARCSPPCSAGRRHLRSEIELATAGERHAEVDGGCRRSRSRCRRSSPTDLRLNTPRYASAAQHHEGQEEAHRHLDPAGFGVDTTPRCRSGNPRAGRASPASR